MAVLTKAHALQTWTELQRLVSVGAHEERSVEHYENNTWPEDGVEESIDNLTEWAAGQGLEFVWITKSKTWSLEPIEQGSEG